jgi:hypothetical protein
MAVGSARSAALVLAAAVLGSLCLVALSEDGAYVHLYMWAGVLHE